MLCPKPRNVGINLERREKLLMKAKRVEHLRLKIVMRDKNVGVNALPLQDRCYCAGFG
jgi:hypothetical protein